MQYTKNIFNKKGFSLIELAIVLIIMGVTVSMGTFGFMRLLETVKLRQSKGNVDGALESVALFSSTGKRLPTVSEFSAVVTKDVDDFGTNLLYVPASELISLNGGGVCMRRTTALTVQRCGSDSGCASPDTVTNVAFVVISGSVNKNIQTANSTPVRIFNEGVANIDNYSGGTDPSLAEGYDDYVRYITLNELKIRANCISVPLKIVTKNLPVGYEKNPYDSTITAVGGVEFDDTFTGNYEWCIETASGSLSANLSRLPANIPVTTDCAAATFQKSDNLQIYTAGTDVLNTYGTVSVKVYVKDADGNTSEKNYIITVNPEYVPASGS